MTSKTTNRFSLEVRTPRFRIVLDHASEHPSRWAAVTLIAGKIGCTPQRLHDWVMKAEIDSGQRADDPTEMADKLKALERENGGGDAPDARFSDVASTRRSMGRRQGNR